MSLVTSVEKDLLEEERSKEMTEGMISFLERLAEVFLVASRSLSESKVLLHSREERQKERRLVDSGRSPPLASSVLERSESSSGFLEVKSLLNLDRETEVVKAQLGSERQVETRVYSVHSSLSYRQKEKSLHFTKSSQTL